jgi:predicted Zn-dependent protease
MKIRIAIRHGSCLFAAALIAGCAIAPPGPTPEPPPALPPVPVSDNSAVLALVDGARTELAAERYPAAGAALVRALRIEPRNPRLWHELAQLKLRQGEYAQAEGMAARSNSWAGSDRALKAANWRLIADARLRLGNETGAQAALAKAEELER